MNSEDIALELFNLLDNIDTLSDVCRDDDKFYRRLVMREVKKRFDFAVTDGYKVAFKTGNKAIDEPAADYTYKPTYVYSYTDKQGNIRVIREVQ